MRRRVAATDPVAMGDVPDWIIDSLACGPPLSRITLMAREIRRHRAGQNATATAAISARRGPS
jgi:hypothetical protein